MIIYESSYFGIAFFIQKNIFQFQITMTNFILNKETMEIEKKMNHQKKTTKTNKENVIIIIIIIDTHIPCGNNRWP